MTETRVQAFERRTQKPLTYLALFFLVVYALPIIDTHLPHWLATSCTVISWGIWAAFALDYLTRLGLTPARGVFVRTHIPELLTVALPMLRPLRVLRVLSLANLMSRRRDSTLLLSVAQVIAGAVTLLVTIGALAMLDAERGAKGANITTVGDAFWWAIVTITTVGYGDYYPVTFVGRVIATIMMLLGIALLGVVTAGISGWLLTQLAQDQKSEEE